MQKFALIPLLVLLCGCCQITSPIDFDPEPTQPPSLECPSIDEIMQVCSGEAPEELQSFAQEDTGGATCMYTKPLSSDVQESMEAYGAEYEGMPILQIVIIPVESAIAADMSFQFAVQPFIAEEDVIARDEIGRKSLRANHALGFATSSAVVIITETNDNNTCSSDELLQLGQSIIS